LTDGQTKIPKISIVVAARNDNYGGDFLQRMQSFTNVLIYMCEKHRLDTELIIVEWNPPKENPSIANALKWPASHPHTQIRIIRVSEELHKNYPGSERLPLLEFVAKNVGVRRARGEYILATNPDIIFPDEIIKYLSATNFPPNHFYRSVRYDVTFAPNLEQSPDEYLDYCNKHVSRINGYFGSFDNNLASRTNIRRIFWSWFGYFLWRLKYFPLVMPFTNASGDFMMMQANYWHTLHGYPEIIGSDENGLFHIDTFLVWEALFLGLKQVRLNNRLRIYHMEHGRPRILNLAGQAVEDTRNNMLKARKPVIINDDNWGLGKYNLPEQYIL
jgi:hypothetical protein